MLYNFVSTILNGIQLVYSFDKWKYLKTIKGIFAGYPIELPKF
jgi:hypothetical protein